jgi:hypothetical protein
VRFEAFPHFFDLLVKIACKYIEKSADEIGLSYCLREASDAIARLICGSCPNVQAQIHTNEPDEGSSTILNIACCARRITLCSLQNIQTKSSLES